MAFPWWTSVKYRGTQLDSLFEWAEVNLDPSLPFVLAGDMNASPAWPVYRSLAERWDDLVARWAEQSGNRLMPTWAWRPGWPRMLRIDHVFGRGSASSRRRWLQYADPIMLRSSSISSPTDPEPFHRFAPAI